MDTLKNFLIGCFILIMVLLGGYYALFELPKALAPKVGEVQKATNEVKRDVYKTNPRYLEGKTKDLAHHLYEYRMTKDESEKESIQQIIAHQFADFDADAILDSELRDFLKACRKGEPY